MFLFHANVLATERAPGVEGFAFAEALCPLSPRRVACSLSPLASTRVTLRPACRGPTTASVRRCAPRSTAPTWLTSREVQRQPPPRLRSLSFYLAPAMGSVRLPATRVGMSPTCVLPRRTHENAPSTSQQSSPAPSGAPQRGAAEPDGERGAAGPPHPRLLPRVAAVGRGTVATPLAHTPWLWSRLSQHASRPCAQAVRRSACRLYERLAPLEVQKQAPAAPAPWTSPLPDT